MGHGTDREQAQPTPAEPNLPARYADASETCRAIARQVGPGYDEHPEWRAAERTANQLWKQARAVGHTVNELLAASRTTA